MPSIAEISVVFGDSESVTEFQRVEEDYTLAADQLAAIAALGKAFGWGVRREAEAAAWAVEGSAGPVPPENNKKATGRKQERNKPDLRGGRRSGKGG